MKTQNATLQDTVGYEGDRESDGAGYRRQRPDWCELFTHTQIPPDMLYYTHMQE